MASDGIITTTLTNPGIIDRLEQDIANYLSPFGFRLERINDEAATRTYSNGSCGNKAVLMAPRLSYSYTSDNDNQSFAAANSSADVVQSSSTTPGINSNKPLGTLHLHVQQESLLPTIGPLLRTFLRISPPHISPLHLRSVIHCHFALDALQKFDKMNTEQKRTQLARQEELSAKRMAHHVHMLVRNSMGSALCMELVVILPCYWRRKIIIQDDGVATSSDRESTIVTRTKVPVALDSMTSAMRDNPDACYPSVQLIQQSHIDGIDGDDSDNLCNTPTCASTEIHLDVRTRMCTVRHQPLIFRWMSSLEGAEAKGNDDEYGKCNASVNSTYGQQDEDSGTFVDSRKMTLIVTCIEKVANMHRILMLCHDYGKSDCSSKSSANEDEESSQSAMLSNMVVILPNESEQQKAKTLREFDEAIDNFHKVIIEPEKDQYQCDGYIRRYRPTFVYEENAAEKIFYMINQQKCSIQSLQQTQPPSIVGIDLHPDALTLYGDYANTDQTQAALPALRKMRDADAIVFGYESRGIPDNIANQLNGWVQIPSRSSINVVAAMSIVLDALMGAGAGSCST